MTTVLSPSPAFDILGSTGAPASGYQLFSYSAGTTTKLDAYTDSTGNTALPNPIILNTRGDVAASATGPSTGLWLDPAATYKFVLAPPTDTDPPTNAIWTLDNVVNPVAAVQAQIASYMAQLAGVEIGTQVPYGGTTAPPGWLLCDGSAVSRTTYALLFAVIGTAYGIGDGSSTFNLPDKRGSGSVGKDDMGGSAANRLTVTVAGVAGNTLGAHGGDQRAQQDTLTATVVPTVHVTDPGHSHAPQAGGLFLAYGVSGVANIVGGSVILSSAMTSVTTAMTITATATAAVVSGLTGGSQNIPPVEVDNWIIYCGV